MPRTLLVTLLLLGCASLVTQRSTVALLRRPASGALHRARAAAARLPLAFEANGGQSATDVRFLARGPGYGLFLTGQEAVLALPGGAPAPLAARGKRREVRRAAHRGGSTLRMKLIGANPRTLVRGAAKLPGRVSYFRGSDPKRWRTELATYAQVRCEEVYPGIDLLYYGNQGRLEHDFVVAPGAAPERIAWEVSGAERAEIDAATGDLVLRTPAGEVRQQKPVAYQEIGGKRVSVAACYRLLGARSVRPSGEVWECGCKGAWVKRTGRSAVTPAHPHRPTRIGFEVAAYDRTKSVTIDPILIFSTYVGGASSSGKRPRAGSAATSGSSGDSASDVAVDAAGNAYLTGFTVSSDFPITPGAFQTTFEGFFVDAFVTKINATGTAILYSSFLGGGQPGPDYATDVGESIAVDASGSAYVAGYTEATDFPTTPAARQRGYTGGTDAFISRIDPTGSSLMYSSYLGGGEYDTAQAVAVDDAGAAYVTGTTTSANFPTRNALQPTNHNGTAPSAFVTKVNTTASGAASVVYSTYLGGTDDDYGDRGSAILVDATGSVYVGGEAGSADFPLEAPLRATFGGYLDVFLAKLNPAGSALVFSTFLGGEWFEEVLDLAADPAGDVYLLGWSGSEDFPTTAGAFQETKGPGDDAFVAKISRVGTQLLYSTFLGGTGDEFPWVPRGGGIGVDNDGNAWVTGGTRSFDFPTTPDALAREIGGTPLLRTTNAAGLWSPSDAGLPHYDVLSLAMDPVVPTTLYAGTAGRGIYRSTDAGASWSVLGGVLATRRVEQVLVNPSNGSTLLALAPPPGYASGEFVFRSDDGGSTWAAISTGLPASSVSALAVAPGAATLYAGTFDGVYKSTNGGTSWSLSNQGIPFASIFTLVIDPQTPTTVYAGTFDGLFRSTDGGANWSPRGSGITEQVVDVIAIDPNNSSILFASTGNLLFKSTNGGQSWSQSGPFNFGVRSLAIDPQTPGTLYAGSYRGISKSTDYGETWNAATLGFGFVDVLALAIDPSTPSRLYAAPGHGTDAFVAKLNSTGTGLVYSTYLGGSAGEDSWGAGLAVDALGAVYITGETSSPDFPTHQPLQPGLKGDTDAFLVKLGEANETPPADPDGLTAASAGAAVALSWNDQSTNEGAFFVERRVGAAGWSQIGAVRANRTTFSDRTAPSGMPNTYRVRALNPKGYSGYSNEATAVPVSGDGRLTFTPKRGVSFGTLKKGQTQLKRVQLKNRGSGPLQVEVGAPDAPFSVVTGAGSHSVLPGANLSVDLVFAPTKRGSFTGVLPVQTDAPGQPQVDIPLSGKRR